MQLTAAICQLHFTLLRRFNASNCRILLSRLNNVAIVPPQRPRQRRVRDLEVLGAPRQRANSSDNEDWARCVVGAVGGDSYADQCRGRSNTSNDRSTEVVGVVDPRF